MKSETLIEKTMSETVQAYKLVSTYLGREDEEEEKD